MKTFYDGGEGAMNGPRTHECTGYSRGVVKGYRKAESVGEFYSMFYFAVLTVLVRNNQLSHNPRTLVARCLDGMASLESEEGIKSSYLQNTIFLRRPGPVAIVLEQLIANAFKNEETDEEIAETKRYHRFSVLTERIEGFIKALKPFAPRVFSVYGMKQEEQSTASVKQIWSHPSHVVWSDDEEQE